METNQDKLPNVLFIMVDDLNDYQSVYGGHPQAQTPNINKLAQSGTMFTNGHTNVPVCSPSRNSLMTGIYPHNSRDFGWTPHYKHAVLKNHKTFIELFKENGYQTYGTGKLLHKNLRRYWTEWGVPESINYGPHAYSGINENGKRIMGHPSVPEPFRSINSVDGSFASLADTPFTIDRSGHRIKTGWTYGKKTYNYTDDNNRDQLPDEQHAEWIVNKIKWLEENNTSPFFIGVGFVNPHTPLYAPQEYFDMYPLDSIKMPVVKSNDKDDTHYASVYESTEMGIAYYKKLKQAFPNDNEGLRKFLQAYLACVAFVDDQIGKVIEALDNSKFKDNTIIVLVSDHGWQMGEKDYLYKNSPWEESTRIPFIIRDPQRSQPGSQVEHAVSLIDIFPTFKDLCQLKGSITKNHAQSQLDGFSLKPFLEDARTTNWEGPEGALTVLGAGINKPIEGLGFSSNPGALWHIEITKDLDTEYVWQQNYTYRTKEWRYILYHNGKEELYHNSEDPFEWHNLAVDSKYHNIKAKLKSELELLIN
ncbi:hypothetical protein GCM10007028_27260 [Algibacter mikhailovii]|uniref:Sulfatase N-terminal domain-containing protein n=2 Tax=Algibacter mikhailovii TaxID=425498 RepID=A0A918R6G4_9FLAO|nr:hypothetical protein GCM10007028_27260 [Algibacter mikhailovii]